MHQRPGLAPPGRACSRRSLRSVEGGLEEVREVFSGRCSRSTSSISSSLLKRSRSARPMTAENQPQACRARAGHLPNAPPLANLAAQTPWVITKDWKAIEQSTGNTKIYIWYTSFGQIKATVASDNGSVPVTTLSPVIHIAGQGVAMLTIALTFDSKAKSLTLGLNGEEVDAGGSPLDLTAGPG